MGGHGVLCGHSRVQTREDTRLPEDFPIGSEA